MDKAGFIAAQLSADDIETALRTLAEMVSEGHHADLSLRQQEVAEKVHQLWGGDELDDDELDA